MEFKQLFAILKKHLSDGADVPSFFRDLIAMITDVTEAEWGTKRDPSAKQVNDETIRGYIKRKFPKKFAQAIVYRLTPEVLIERINERPENVRLLLAEDLHGYDSTLDADNVGEAVAKWVVEIIHAAAGLIAQDELEQKKQQQLAIDLKMKFGEYLLNEANDHCPFPGCGKKLTIARDGKIVRSYEVGLIDKKRAANFDNLLAMCPRCYGTYLLDDNNSMCRDLRSIKAVLTTHNHSTQLLNEMPLEKGIVGVIRKITALKEKDLRDAELDPKELSQKIRPDDNMALYTIVKNYVTTYFIRIREIMIGLNKRGEIDYDEMQDQMHAIYKRLKKSRKTSVDIFYEIAAKIHYISLQSEIYCQIVVSYFIQSCEVFDAIPE